ncbi:MAG: OsmC family protein [Actinomycetaceae bacterium]|nr:OsmC family protein [Actinomycetaceae bacterium]
MATDVTQATEATEEKHEAEGTKEALWLERVGKGSYVAHNSKGASVPVGHAEGEFSPGELLQVALAGCNATSSDARYSAALGDDYKAMVGVEGEWDKETNRYLNMVIEIVTDMSGLSDEEREKLETRVRRSIDRHCTVGHTLNAGMPNDLILTSEG